MSNYTNIIINENTGICSGNIDGIQFSSIDLSGGYKPIAEKKIAPKNSIFSSNDNRTNKSLIINAVDIDWNGAIVGENKTINTTGELLSWVKDTFDTLLERIKTLERAYSNLVPQESEDESYNVIIPESNEPLTLEEIIANINPDAEKPEVVQSLNMTELSNPTDTYLVYPLSWEIIENNQIVSPVIKDWNGFEIGFNINEDTPTVMVNGVEYRVSDIKLGQGNYTIEFK